MSFLLNCCMRVELDEEEPVIQKNPKGKLESRTVVVVDSDPIPIPITVAVKVQPEGSTSYQSFQGKPGIAVYNSGEDSSSDEDV